MRGLNTPGRLNILHCAAVVFCFIAVAKTASTLRYTGVNLTGPEWTGATSGPFWPNTYEIDYFISRGMNIFRLPFAWELMQPTLGGALDQGFLNRYTSLVNYITNTKQLSVIVDPHNYARYNGAIASSSSLADLWTKLANQFKSNSRVIFGIMNEPNTMSTVTWRNNANAAIAAIRATGATNLILVPGNGWTGAGSWTDTWYDTVSPQVSNAVAMLGITDSGNNYAFELHTYFDSDSSGTHIECVAPPTVPSHLQVVTNWLKTNNKKGFLGEFGGSGQTNCIKAFNDSLNYLESNSDVWLGWTYWGAGPRFGSAFLTVEPTGYPPKPNSKLNAIKPHMKNPIVALVYPTIPACTAADHIIYDDQLQNGWQDWSWATHSLTSTHSMSGNAVSFVPSNNAAFWVSRPSGQNFSIASYNALQFGIAGDAPGNQAIDVSFWITGGTPNGASTPPIDYVVNRTISLTYRVATIPFSVLDIPSDKRITGITWQDYQLLDESEGNLDSNQNASSHLLSDVKTKFNKRSSGQVKKFRLVPLGVYKKAATLDILPQARALTKFDGDRVVFSMPTKNFNKLEALPHRNFITIVSSNRSTTGNLLQEVSIDVAFVFVFVEQEQYPDYVKALRTSRNHLVVALPKGYEARGAPAPRQFAKLFIEALNVQLEIQATHFIMSDDDLLHCIRRLTKKKGQRVSWNELVKAMFKLGRENPHVALISPRPKHDQRRKFKNSSGLTAHNQKLVLINISMANSVQYLPEQLLMLSDAEWKELVEQEANQLAEEIYDWKRHLKLKISTEKGIEGERWRILEGPAKKLGLKPVACRFIEAELKNQKDKQNKESELESLVAKLKLNKKTFLTTGEDFRLSGQLLHNDINSCIMLNEFFLEEKNLASMNETGSFLPTPQRQHQRMLYVLENSF